MEGLFAAGKEIDDFLQAALDNVRRNLVSDIAPQTGWQRMIVFHSCRDNFTGKLGRRHFFFSRETGLELLV